MSDLFAGLGAGAPRPALRHAVAAGRGLLRSARRRACCSPTSTASASPRGCWRSCAWASAARPTCPTGWRRTCCSSAPRRVRPTDGRRRRAWRPCARPSSLAQPRAGRLRSRSGLGRFDPALIAQARKRVAGAKDAWSAVAGGELHRLPGLAEQFALVGDSLQRLYPSGETLAERAAGRRRADGAAGGARRAPRWRWKSPPACSTSTPRWKTATSTIPTHGRARAAPGAAHRARAPGRHAPSRSKPWMEELYRRVSDRQTMGSVVQELRASLSEAEKAHRPVLPQPGRARRADPGARPAAGDARRAVGARAWTRPRTPCCACATTSTR